MGNLHSDEQAGQVIRLAYGAEKLQFGELHLPAGAGSRPHPTVVMIHGGFWHTPYGYTLMTGLAEDLAQRGIAVWNIEYRRVGDRGGGWPNTLTDVARSADYLYTIAPTYEIDLQRVVTIGHSAGGHLALWLAARPKIAGDSDLAVNKQEENNYGPLQLAGAISLAGVSNLEMCWKLKLGNGAAADLLGGSPTKFPERYAAASPTAMLPIVVPQILIHGTEDDRVPHSMSEAYTSAAQAAGDKVRFITLKGVEHFALIDAHSVAWDTTVEALRMLLLK